MSGKQVAVVNYRPDNETVSPEIYDSLNTVLDSFEESTLFLDTRTTNLRDKARWERFFDEILSEKAHYEDGVVERDDNPDYRVDDEPLESLTKLLSERPEDIEYVDAGPTINPDLKENGVNKFNVAGASTIQNPDADHYLGKFHDEDPELPEGTDEAFRFYGMIDEVDNQLADHIEETSNQEDSRIILRKSPNDIAYTLEERGTDTIEANLQGPEKRRDRNGLTENEQFGIHLHRTPK